MYFLIYACLFDLDLFDVAKDQRESTNIGKLYNLAAMWLYKIGMLQLQYIGIESECDDHNRILFTMRKLKMLDQI